MTLQASSSPLQTSVPPDAYAVDAPSARGQYSQRSPRLGDSYRSPASPQSSRRPSKRPSDNAAPSSSNLITPQNPQHRSPATSQLSSASINRGQPSTPTTHPSPMIASNPTSSPAPVGPREQPRGYGGPPIPPPPRTSSNQNNNGVDGGLPIISLPDRTLNSVPPGRVMDGPGRREHTGERSEDRRKHELQPPHPNTESRSNDDERVRNNPATTAAAAARARRKGPASPQDPQSSGDVRASRAQQSPTSPLDRSTINAHDRAALTGSKREASDIINRVVVADPDVDLVREQERLAEALPNSVPNSAPAMTLESAVNDVVDTGGRGAGRNRQDFSASANAARRKETEFGEYVLGQTLGEGEFGKVKLGWKKDGSVQVAIKLIRRENLNTNPSRLPKIYREISILSQLSHPNIVRLHEMVETDRQIGIILEYASGGELFDYILTHRYLKDGPARRLFAQLVSGVGYLHKKGIVHRDLKLENLLLDRNRNIIITDFGFANTFNPRDELGDDIERNLTNRDFVKKMDLERVHDGFRRGDLMQTSCGSPCYAAPELVVTDSLYTGRKVDVWSCGVILYAMLAGYLPFDDDPANPEGDNINLLYKYIVSTPLTFPEYVTPHARDLLRRILVPDPRRRADLFEVARHSWLSEFSHVVSHVTSSTTTVGEIANSTVTANNVLEAPLLARSASVREPSKPHTSNMSPVGGLSHQGKIDPEQAEKSKPPRDGKRRTVQVEYVAPQSQTFRGEASPPLPPPALQPMPANPAAATVSKTRARSGSQGAVDVPWKTNVAASVRKPLPQDPPVDHEARNLQEYQASLGSSRTQQRPVTSQPRMQPPVRPAREHPRSASEIGTLGQSASSSVARPNTSGSMTSTGAGRLPSRGNSYSQPLAPTVAATNAEGRLAQPKSSRQYNISAPIPQPEPFISDASIGRPSTQRTAPRHSQVPQPREETKSHKRSNTFTNVFGRSGSFFGGRSQTQSPVEHNRPPSEKRYPPTAMKGPIASESPRQSTDSRRPSFSFGRKNSDLGAKPEKPRRFSILPASFSFKGLTGSGKESASDSRPNTGRKLSVSRAPNSQGGIYSRNPAFEDSEENIPVYDGIRDRQRNAPVVLSPQDEPSYRTGLQSQLSPYPAQYASQPMSAPPRTAPAGQSYLMNESGPPTESDISINRPQPLPRYPPGFSSHDDEPPPRSSMQHGWNGRGPGVLQKPNRKFGDAYDQDHDPGHHAGSSGAAKRVMDFFRRRGKARSGDDR